MNTENNYEYFEHFRKLRQCVAELVSCRSLLEASGKQSVAALDDLSRKMEISALVQQREIVAITGMQGTGKTTLIKNVYNLPDNMLRISSERGEVVPVFITESGSLQENEYKAQIVYFDDHNFCREDLDVNSVAEKTRRAGKTAYIEIFVPYKIFHRDNGGFVLLPGFEKNDDRGFNKAYNSLMEYTLHFSKAVILVTDDTGIANEEIDILIDMLGENFNPRNCIFAISKCDTKDADQSAETQESLYAICKEKGLNIDKNQIVCTGEYRKEEQNEAWKNKLLEAVDTYVDFESAQKTYRYYKPMMDEILTCADQLEISLRNVQIDNETLPDIYGLLKDALDAEENRFEEKLSAACNNAQAIVRDNFRVAYGQIDKSHKKTKKFIFFQKSYEELYDDRAAIRKECEKCLISGNRSVLMAKYADVVANDKPRLAQTYNDHLLNCVPGGKENSNLLPQQITSDAKQTALQLKPAQIQAENNRLIREYIDPLAKIAPTHDRLFFPEKTAVAQVIGTEFSAMFDGMLLGQVNISNIPIRTSGVYSTMSAISATHTPNTSVAKAITLLDLLDGKADILESAVSVFTDGSDAEISAACGAVGIAIAVVAVAKKGLDLYNANVLAQNALGAAWENALMNAVEEQKNVCLDNFNEAKKAFLEYIVRVHRVKRGIDEQQQRVASASYAVSNIKQLAARFDDRYAATF